MQIRRPAVALFLLLIFFKTPYAQTTYLPQGAKEAVLLERMEIKLGTDSILNFSKTKPFSRARYIGHLSRLDSSLQLSKVDRYNFYSAMVNNLEWAYGNREDYLSKKPIWKAFYKTPATLYEVNQPDFFLAVNPVFQYTLGKENNQDQSLFLNTRGVTLRAALPTRLVLRLT